MPEEDLDEQESTVMMMVMELTLMMVLPLTAATRMDPKRRAHLIQTELVAKMEVGMERVARNLDMVHEVAAMMSLVLEGLETAVTVMA